MKYIALNYSNAPTMYFQIAMLASLIGIITAFIPGAELLIVKYRLAKAALWLSILVAVCRLLALWATAETVINKIALLSAYNWGKSLLFFGVAWLTTLLIRAAAKENKLAEIFNRLKRGILNLTIWTAAIMCVSFYFMVSIGKMRNAKEMESFFIQSGYPAALNYVIIGVECFFSIGLLLHAKIRSGLLSAIMLLFVMLGAVFTHWRNGDPIAASYDAFSQLLILCFLVALYLVERKYRKATI